MTYNRHAIIRKQRTGVSLLLVLCLVLSLIPSGAVFGAAKNRLSIAKTPQSKNIGEELVVTIGGYVATSLPPGSAGSVSGVVTYSSNLLQLVRTSTSPSSYTMSPTSSGPGTISFSGTRSAATETSGTLKDGVFTATFRAIAAGTATIGFDPNVSKINNMDTEYITGTYPISNPNPPATNPTPSPPKTTPKPVPVITPPVQTPSVTPTEDLPEIVPDPSGIIDSVVVDPLYSSSTVTWKVNLGNPTAKLTYGSSSGQLDKQATDVKNNNGTFSTTISGLTPGVRYYFAVSASGDGGKSGNYTGTIITRGFPVTITVTENNQPAKNAQVKIGTRSYTTASNGKLSIGLAEGNYNGTVTTETASPLTIQLAVAKKTISTDGTSPPSQSFSYNLTSSPLEQGPGSSMSIFAFIGILLGGTVVLALGFMGFMAYRRRRFESGTTTKDTSTVIIEDGYDWRSQAVAPEAMLPLPPPLPYSQAGSGGHNNSVHIDEAEPLDMFEQAKILPVDNKTTKDVPSDETAQSPNSPHSTTP